MDRMGNKKYLGYILRKQICYHVWVFAREKKPQNILMKCEEIERKRDKPWKFSTTRTVNRTISSRSFFCHLCNPILVPFLPLLQSKETSDLLSIFSRILYKWNYGMTFLYSLYFSQLNYFEIFFSPMSLHVSVIHSCLLLSSSLLCGYDFIHSFLDRHLQHF